MIILLLLFLTSLLDKGQRMCWNALVISYHINFVMVPANTTDRLQPLDVSVNKPAKEFLWKQFHEWYANEICKQLQSSKPVSPVDLKLSVMKPLGAQWMIKLCDYLQSKPEIIQNGFKHVGINSTLNDLEHWKQWHAFSFETLISHSSLIKFQFCWIMPMSYSKQSTVPPTFLLLTMVHSCSGWQE